MIGGFDREINPNRRHPECDLPATGN